jgi:drug/metabolite transporter (DMT)-like permease
MASESPAYSQALIATTLLIYCFSGTALTLINKLAILAYPYPNALLVLQNGVTVLLLLLGSYFHSTMFQSMPKITIQIIKSWFPLVLLFVLMLLSSLQALRFVSATTLIVMRNLSTLFVAFFERLVLNEEIKPMTWFALIMILIGAIIYGARDMTFNMTGYVYLFLNIAGTSSYQIYVKKLIAQSKELGPFGMSYINNMLSLPVFILFSAYGDELPHYTSMFSRGTYATAVIILSALLGFSLSTSAFMMNKMISATSMMVANNVNKFAVIILSELFVERTLDDVSAFGTLIVMFFGWFYSKTKSKGWSFGEIFESCKGMISKSAPADGVKEVYRAVPQQENMSNSLQKVDAKV